MAHYKQYTHNFDYLISVVDLNKMIVPSNWNINSSNLKDILKLLLKKEFAYYIVGASSLENSNGLELKIVLGSYRPSDSKITSHNLVELINQTLSARKHLVL